MNAVVLLQLLIQLTANTQAVAALLRRAQSENRDVTQEELDVLFANDDIAKAALDAAIAAAKAEGK